MVSALSVLSALMDPTYIPSRDIIESKAGESSSGFDSTEIRELHVHDDTAWTRLAAAGQRENEAYH